jgi:AAA ATPase domain
LVVASEPIAINLGKLDPRDLVGRKAEIDLCWTRLSTGSSLLVTGERRIGKSSIAQHLAFVPKPDWVVIYIDVEAIETVEQLIRAIVAAASHLEALPRKVRNGMSALLDKIGKVTVLGTGIELHQRAAKESYEVLALLIDRITNSNKLLLILDELPILAKTLAKDAPDDALLLLRTLRALRSNHPNHRQLLCGSIGLHHLLTDSSEINAAVNDLYTIPVRPLQHDAAIELAQRLLAGIGRDVALNDPLLEAIVEATDGIAFYEHHLVATLQLSGVVTLDSVARARNTGVSSQDDPWKTVHYVKRIDEYFGPEADLANAILDSVAKAGPAGVSVDGVLNDLQMALNRAVDRQEVLAIIHRLRLDHYIDFDDSVVPNVLRFCFRVVRDSWIARRGR